MRNPFEALFIRADVDEVAPRGRFRLIRLHAPQLRGVDWTPGQQVRVDCKPAGAMFPVLRTYSVWDHDEDWLELYCLVHGDGPGSAWAAAVAPGDEALLTRPKGDFVTSPAAYHLFVGEETAAAAFGPMIRALPDGVPVVAVLEAGDAADRLPVGKDEWWVTRPPGASAASSAALVAAVRALDLPAGPGGAAYLAGEARTIQAVRSALVDVHGLPRRAVATKPFWTPGKRGME